MNRTKIDDKKIAYVACQDTKRPDIVCCQYH